MCTEPPPFATDVGVVFQREASLRERHACGLALPVEGAQCCRQQTTAAGVSVFADSTVQLGEVCIRLRRGALVNQLANLQRTNHGCPAHTRTHLWIVQRVWNQMNDIRWPHPRVCPVVANCRAHCLAMKTVRRVSHHADPCKRMCTHGTSRTRRKARRPAQYAVLWQCCYLCKRARV